MQSGGECDGFRALAAVSPSCPATVVKSHRTWIQTLRFHPPAQCIANGGPQGSHLNPPSNGASTPARVPCMCAPPKFSIKAVHAAAWGSLLVSHWLSHIQNLRPPHWSWALPSASYKLLKNITSLLFLSAELGRHRRGWRRTCEHLRLTHLGRVTILPAHSFSYTCTSALAALKCRSTVEQGPPPIGTAEQSLPQ